MHMTQDLGLRYMDKWKPVTIDGEKTQGVASYYIFPDDCLKIIKMDILSSLNLHYLMVFREESINRLK